MISIIKSNAELAAEEGNDPMHSMTPLERIEAEAKECLTLHARNMTYWKEKTPALIKVFEGREAKPEKVGIAWMEDGEINLRMGDHWLYEPNARTYAAKQVEAFIRTPSRVVFTKPNTSITEDKNPLLDAEGEVWLTRKYDNKADDFHFGRFVVDISKACIESGMEIQDKITRNQPCYLVVWGIGLGYHIKPLIEHFKPEMLVLMESQMDALWRSTFTFDWQDVNDYCTEENIKIKLLVDGNATELVRKLGGIIHGESLMGLDGVTSVLHQNDPILKVAFNEFQSAKTANLASFIGFITDEYNMMKNSFRNLRQGNKRMLKQAHVKTKLPVMIVGSGPSLEDNIEGLKRIRDKVLLIASGSNLKVLFQHGIIPDFQCNLERAQSIFERHQELAEAGYTEQMKQVYAVMTSTIWPGIDNFFKDTVYFLRPALSPVGVFCEHMDQILQNEGPQVANTAFAFAKQIGAREIYLLGVDLGSSDPKRPRAGEAWQGQRPRYLTMPVRGNFGKTVFTDMPLTQQRETLQEQIKKINKADGKVYNLGHGARIEGALAKHIEEVELADLTIDRATHTRELVEQFPVYTRERFVGSWLSAKVRESVAQMMEAMIHAIDNATVWDYKLVKKLEHHCAYVGKPVREQYAPRLVRGSVLRIFMHVNSIMLRLKDQAQAETAFATLKPVLLDHLRTIEMEGYSLADELETEDEAFAPKFA